MHTLSWLCVQSPTLTAAAITWAPASSRVKFYKLESLRRDSLLLVLRCPVNKHGGLYLGRTEVALTLRLPSMLSPPAASAVVSPWFLLG